MYLRIFILSVAALLIVLETTFLPCRYVNAAMPFQPDAGYHTFSNINTEMVLDGRVLACELGITILLCGAALTIAGISAKTAFKKILPRTWRSKANLNDAP